VDAAGELLETLARELQGLRVAVEPDEGELGEPAEERLRVPGESQRRVDEHGAIPLEGGGEQLDRALQQHRDVDVVLHEVPGADPCSLIPIRI